METRKTVLLCFCLAPTLKISGTLSNKTHKQKNTVQINEKKKQEKHEILSFYINLIVKLCYYSLCIWMKNVCVNMLWMFVNNPFQGQNTPFVDHFSHTHTHRHTHTHTETHTHTHRHRHTHTLPLLHSFRRRITWGSPRPATRPWPPCCPCVEWLLLYPSSAGEDRLQLAEADGHVKQSHSVDTREENTHTVTLWWSNTPPISNM